MSNSSGNLSGCHPQHFHPSLPIFFSLIVVTGFVLNCISLWIFWFKVKEWNATVVLQFNLAITDAIITPAAPFIVIYAFTEHWTFGLFFCQFNTYLISIHMYGSIFFLMIISIHRYCSIAHNCQRPALTRKPFITKVCLFSWCCMLVEGIPVFFLKISEVHGVSKCLYLYQTEQAALYFIANWLTFFFGLLTPFSIIFVCYTLLSRHLLKINPMNNLSKTMVSKSVRITFVSLIIFIISYIPLHIARSIAVTMMLFFPTSCPLLENIEVAYQFTSIMFATNCCMDPILYCYASDKFKTMFTSWFTFLQRWQHEGNITHGNPDEATIDNHHHHHGSVVINSRETNLTAHL